MALFNDPAIDKIVRYSAGGGTPPAPDAKAMLARLDSLASAKEAATSKAAQYGVSTSGGQEGEAPVTQYYRIEGGGDGERTVPVSADEFNAAQDTIDWVAEAKKIATESGFDPKVIPNNSNPYMYGAMRAQMQGHSDPLRMLAISGLEPTKGNIGMAEMFYNNPNATKKDLEEAFKQATKGGGALRQILGDDIMNALPAVLAIAGNIAMPGLGTGVGAAFGAGAGSALNGASGADIVKAMALTYGGANLGAVAKDLAGSAVKTATTGMDLGAGATKALTQVTTNILKDAGTAVLTGKPIDIGKSVVNSGIGLAGNAADSYVTDIGGDLAGNAARVVTTTGLRGGNVNNALGNFATNTMIDTGVNAIKNTDTYQGLTDSLNIDGFSIPGGFDLSIPGVSAKDATALVGALPGGKQITNAISVLKNPTVSGIKSLTTGAGNTKAAPTVRRTAAPPAAVLAANKPTTTPPAVNGQPPAAVLAAINQRKPVG